MAASTPTRRPGRRGGESSKPSRVREAGRTPASVRRTARWTPHSRGGPPTPLSSHSHLPGTPSLRPQFCPPPGAVQAPGSTRWVAPVPGCPLPSGGSARPALHWWSSGPGASTPSLPGTGAPQHGFWSRHHRPNLPTTPTRPLMSPWPAPDATRPGQEQEVVLASLISWLHDPESKVGRKESRRVPGGGGVDGAHGDTDTARKCRQVEAARGEEGQRPLVMERTAWAGGTGQDTLG